MPTKTCFRHPGTPARRQCFNCRKPVCPACQLSLDHHIFCGDECHSAWTAKEKDKSVTKTKKAAADKKGVDALRREIEGLNELIGSLKERMEAVQAENTDLSLRVSAMFLKEQEVIEERDAAAELERKLSELRDRLEGLESADEAIRARLENSGEPVAAEAINRLDGLLARFAELERSHQELQREAREQAADNPASTLDERLVALEKSLAEAMTAFNQPDDSTQAALSKVEIAARRVLLLEAEQQKLREELVRARDETTSVTLQELDGVKKRLRAYEQARIKSSPRRQRQDRQKMMAAGAVLIVLVLALTAILISNFRSGRTAPAAVPNHDDTTLTNSADNIVYDDLEPLLAPPVLDLGAERLALEKNLADIAGYAPGAVSVTLFVNNKKVAQQVVSEHGFEFSAVPLEAGLNLVQVRASDEAGNEAYSMAQVIERVSQVAARVRETLGLNRMRGPRKSGYLSLTIDAGSTNRRSEKILAVLREKGIKTTFFLTGQFIEKYPETVMQIVADGHEVGNHTYNHPHLTTFERNRRHYTAPGVTREVFQEQLLRTRKLFEDLTGKSMVGWWRAPYGEQNEEIRQWAEEIGFRHVDWTRTPVNCDMLDWIADPGHGKYLNAEAMHRRFLSIDGGRGGGAGGAIILMHLGSDRKADFMDEILPPAIDSLRERGYEFISVTGLFAQ